MRGKVGWARAQREGGRGAAARLRAALCGRREMRGEGGGRGIEGTHGLPLLVQPLCNHARCHGWREGGHYKVCVVGAEGVSTRRRTLEGKTCPARATHSELAGEGEASPRSGAASPQSREKDTGVQASHLNRRMCPCCWGDGGYRFAPEAKQARPEMRRALAAPFRLGAPLSRYFATLPPHQLVPSACCLPAAAARAPATPPAGAHRRAALPLLPQCPRCPPRWQQA